MYPFPIEKYKFFIHDIQTDEGLVKEVVAVSSYGGKRVRASARCAPGDTFDLEKGKKLAATRCALKISKKRFRRASQKFQEANRMCDNVRRHFYKERKYYVDAANQFQEINKELNKLEAEI